MQIIKLFGDNHSACYIHLLLVVQDSGPLKSHELLRLTYYAVVPATLE
jgi:hypothetical protein